MTSISSGENFSKQRVAHQHASRAAEAGEHRVGLHRVGRQAHAVDAFDRQARPRSQAVHPLVERGIVPAARSCRTAAGTPPARVGQESR